MKKFTKDEIEKDEKDITVCQESVKEDGNGESAPKGSETAEKGESAPKASETAEKGELAQKDSETAEKGELTQKDSETAEKEESAPKASETAEKGELIPKDSETAANGELNQKGTETNSDEKLSSSEGIQKADEGQNEDNTEGAAVKKNHKKRRIAAVALVMILVIAMALVYGRGVYYYKKHFFPQLEVNGVSCGNLTLQEAAGKVQQWYADNYRLGLLDREGEELAVVLPSDVQMVFSVEEELSRILEEQNAYKWFIYVFSEEGETREIVISPQYDMVKLQRFLEQRGLFDISRGESPQNAYISEYQEELKQFIIVPEREGTVLEREITVACAAEALTGMQDSLDLYETGCFKAAEITADDEQLKKRLEALNKVVGSCITYDWNGTQEILDGELIHQWMRLDGEEITLDEEQVAAYVAQMAKEYDTYGKKRKFVTTSGLTLTLPSGAYGWKTDRNAETEALIELILAGAITEREPIYTSQGWAKGEDDIGDSYVEINLTDQHLYLYIGGELVLETDFVSGNVANGNSTPAGVFGLTYKTRNAVLRGPDYETPVNYWMPFNGNVGMHDATWRRSFGGDIYLTNGSHGCINLPLKMAKTIYDYMSTGFPVICYYY